MNDVYYKPDKINQSLLEKMQDNIKGERTAEDLLFQIMLDWGLELTHKITKETIEGLEVFFVNDNDLVACFEKKGKVTEDFCKSLAKREPLRVVFRDAGFKTDSVKINVEIVFKHLSPRTGIKTI
jgi:adenine-specific DNA-methyltransferase